MTDLEEELFCNAAAANWILSDTGLDAAVVQKRALGVAVGMLMLTARGLGSADSHDGIHPPGYERLVAVLDRHVPNEQEAVWGFLTGMLAFHVSAAKLPAHKSEYECFRDAALEYCEHIRSFVASGK